MNFQLIKDVINLLEEFEEIHNKSPHLNLKDFKQWVATKHLEENKNFGDVYWEGKENGRTIESVINTQIVHMNRYAKMYSKSAMHHSSFSVQEDFIYLINLRAFGAMTKMQLIKKNIHEKPIGMQIINRLIDAGFIEQKPSLTDKRSKMIQITAEGIDALESIMSKIRKATHIVTGDLETSEKMELYRLLNKLDTFHKPVYNGQYETQEIIDKIYIKAIKNN